MLINRHVFRRISRCPLGIVHLCFSIFLWLYQCILRPNNQNKPGPVEHHCFEGKSHNFVYVTNRFKLKQLSQFVDLKNSTINLHFSSFSSKIVPTTWLPYAIFSILFKLFQTLWPCHTHWVYGKDNRHSFWLFRRLTETWVAFITRLVILLGSIFPPHLFQPYTTEL